VRTLKIGFIILTLLFPLFLFGCDDNFIEPDDKWPVITDWEVTSNLTVKLEILKGYGIPRLEVANRTIGFTLDIRSYSVSREWTVYAFLESVTKEYSLYTDNLPGAQVDEVLPITEAFVWDHITGEYLGGTPPGGTIQLTLTMDPEWFPLSVPDWIDYDVDPELGLVIHSITDRYKYNFRIVVEDLDGRSDTTSFSVISPIEIKNAND
jgi:hypothetical protein